MSTATPFWVIVPEALKVPPANRLAPDTVSVEVPDSCPVELDQNGKLLTEMAEEVETEPPPPAGHVASHVPPRQTWLELILPVT